ncbi:MAG: hypothetical protein HYX78_02475 [Armatimonadetes bacterium]|nr:hypothetical protein [Armatimonadota bacterium]
MTGKKVVLICLLILCSLSLSAVARDVTFSVTPAAEGVQLVRTSLPLPKGAVTEGRTIEASDGSRKQSVGFRPLTWHPAGRNEPRSVRRAIVTFPYDFHSKRPVRFTLSGAKIKARGSDARQPVEVKCDGKTVSLSYRNGPSVLAGLVAPERTSRAEPRVEVVEKNRFFLWQRFHVPDRDWPKIIEVRADSLGGVVVVAHLKRNLLGNGRAPDFGWKIETEAASGQLISEDERRDVGQSPSTHSFSQGKSCQFLFDTGRGSYSIYHPTAFMKRRGNVSARLENDNLFCDYLRCRADEKVPMQEASWRRAEFCISPESLAPMTVTLQSPHRVSVDWRLWDELYNTGKPLDLGDQPELAKVLDYHREGILRCVVHGDDWGMVSGFSPDSKTGVTFGMNRLNHCPPIFEEGYRTGDRRLTEAAVLWCDNFYDLSIWWKSSTTRWGTTTAGGTRYNNMVAQNETPPDSDFMWRTNWPSDFCTKGYDSFFYAYEETGDPRMKEALEGQLVYAAKHIHADQGQCRNIGDVRDFVRLYQFTGERRHLDEGIRLFRELRTKLFPNKLFDQSGNPYTPDLPFIDGDDPGFKYGYAKTYIIGYALAGLPALVHHAPQEPELVEVVQAVADFLAESQDPAGGWRYPHPRSSRVLFGLATENAWQIVQADKALGSREKHLDAVERALRQRVLGVLKTGNIPGGITGWEWATGLIKDQMDIYKLYKRPEDRDPTRDYTEGKPFFNGAVPDNLVYFPEVLAHYLKHRPASRLLAPPKADEPLGIVLSRFEGVTE